MVHLLAKIDKIWLQLLLASPVLIGTVKGIWDSCHAKHPNDQEIRKIQAAAKEHTLPLENCLEKLLDYLWVNTLRQYIPVPFYPNVSDRIQKAEHWIRWDSTISPDRKLLFDQIECLAFKGRGLSKLHAVQSLAKIIHSLSIKDLASLKETGVSKEHLLKIMEIRVWL